MTGARVAVLLVSLLVAGRPAAAEDLRLLEAIRNGAAPADVGTLIKQGASVNATDAEGVTALVWAAHQDDLESVRLLARAGADPNLATAYGVTPLTLACVNRSAAVVQALLDAGANPNARQWTGETPLMTCARTGAAEAVGALLSHGADVNATEERQGHTALMRAVGAKHPDVVRRLVAAKADVRARSKGGFTALLFAAQEGDLESARILVAAGADVNEKTSRGPDARRDLTGGLCLRPGEDAAQAAAPDAQCFVPAENPSALLMATASGHEELALFLLDKGADPNAADPYGWTPLHHAIPRGWADISGALFRPFHDRIRRPDLPQLVDALLARGANPNARVASRFSRLAMFTFREYSPIGATPFALAAAAGDLGIMRALLDAGADPRLNLKDGTTPLMLAAGARRIADSVPQERRSADEEANALKAVELLASRGASLEAMDANGQTALHAAATVRAHSIIEFLAAKGVNMNGPDAKGMTPYLLAAKYATGDKQYESTMTLLVKLGAKPLDLPSTALDRP
jgi:ankyrin repeat protein